MGLNASELLGAEQLAGTRVNRRGYGKAIMSGNGAAGGAGAGVSGMVGGALMGRWAKKKGAEERAEAETSTAPTFGKLAFLAVTADELALIDIDARKTVKLADVLARMPRSEVTAVELAKTGPLMAKPLTVRMSNGEHWLLEVPAPLKGDAEKVVKQFA